MHRIALAIAAIFGVFIIAPASAQVVITQTKAIAGNVTPGDSPGFPVTLTQPGAYVLGSNLSVPANAVGIGVNNNNIDIDLKGFTITGNGVGGWGIASPYGEGSIHDGTITQFRNSGIYLRGTSWTIVNMKITRNGGPGVDGSGSAAMEVRGSLISGNGNHGILTGDAAFILNNRITQNGRIGVRCFEACHVEGNVLDRNDFGVETVSGLVIGNTIARSTGAGVFDDGLDTNPFDTGMANNMLINNSPSGVQVVRAIDVHPNTCKPNDCRR